MATAEELFEFGEGGSGVDNSTIKELRAAFERQKAEREELEKENEALKAFQAGVVAEQRVRSIGEVFSAAGLNPKQAQLFSALNPEAAPDKITAESLKAFAEEYGLSAPSKDEGTDGKTTPPTPGAGFKPEGFKPAPVTERESPGGVLSREEWVKLAGSDPAQAQAAWKAGRVDLADVRRGLGVGKDQVAQTV